MKAKKITLFDIMFSVAILVICAVWLILGLLTGKVGNKVVISVDNDILFELPLKDDVVKTVETEYGCNTVCISEGKCYVIDADCKDGICKKHSAIANKGETIVCLPHRLIAEVK